MLSSPSPTAARHLRFPCFFLAVPSPRVSSRLGFLCFLRSPSSFGRHLSSATMKEPLPCRVKSCRLSHVRNYIFCNDTTPIKYLQYVKMSSRRSALRRCVSAVTQRAALPRCVFRLFIYRSCSSCGCALAASFFFTISIKSVKIKMNNDNDDWF